MWLFDVPSGRQVRVTSKKLRWVECDSDETVAENLTWTGRTTNHYFVHGGVRRRLIVDVSFNDYGDYIWQRNIECFVVG
jgi:hypothetical protein